MCLICQSDPSVHWDPFKNNDTFILIILFGPTSGLCLLNKLRQSFFLLILLLIKDGGGYLSVLFSYNFNYTDLGLKQNPFKCWDGIYFLVQWGIFPPTPLKRGHSWEMALPWAPNLTKLTLSWMKDKESLWGFQLLQERSLYRQKDWHFAIRSHHHGGESELGCPIQEMFQGNAVGAVSKLGECSTSWSSLLSIAPGLVMLRKIVIRPFPFSSSF